MLLFFHETGENRSIPPPYGSKVTKSSIFGFSKVIFNLRGFVDFEVIKEIEISGQEIDDEIIMSHTQDSKILKDQMRN